MDDQNNAKISILLPTRGRTIMLKESIDSLINNAQSPNTIEWLLGFDNDDDASSTWFIDNVVPLIEQSGGTYKVLSFPPMGYENLHKYVNGLAKIATGKWFVFWNDDAIMQDQNWDTTISSVKDFCIQAFDTHNKHPYSIFPIVPRKWYELLGYLSKHQLNDAYISQIAWMLDIMLRIDVRVDHRRFDLTGDNKDDTFLRRRIFEGNKDDPRDFNHISQRRFRIHDATKIAGYFKSLGRDMSHWDKILAGDQDPWTKMLEADVNNQVRKIT